MGLYNLRQPLNEVYFGYTPGIARCFDAFSDFRQKYVTSRKFMTGVSANSISADHDKDLNRFIKEMEREFQMYSYTFMIVNDDTPNMMTMSIIAGKPIAPAKAIEVTNTGYKFKKEAEMSVITIAPTALLFNDEFTDREMFAIVLHELGHNFQNYINTKMITLNTVSNVLLVYELILEICFKPIQGIKDLMSLTIVTKPIYNQLSKSFNSITSETDRNNVYSYFNFLIGIYNTFKAIANSAASAALGPLLKVLIALEDMTTLFLNPINHIHGYFGERIADNFASYYGFGEDGATAQVKIGDVTNYGIQHYVSKMPIIGHIYNFLSIPGDILLSIVDVHPSSPARVKGIIDSMETDINDPKLSPKLKKQLSKEIANTKKAINTIYDKRTKITDTNFVRMAFDRFIINVMGGGIKYKLFKMSNLDNDTLETSRKIQNTQEVYNKMSDYNKYLFLESDDEDDDDDEKDKKKDKDKKEKDDNDYLSDYKDNYEDYDDDDDSDDDSNDYLDDSDDSSEEDGDGTGLFELITKCAYSYSVISANMKHIHLNTYGKKFDRIHSLADSYYKHFDSLVDFFLELSLEDTSTKIDNLANSAKHCPEITLETSDKYDYKSGCEAMMTNLRKGIDIIKKTRSASDERTDIQSKLDDELSYLNKEINYFMTRRMKSVDESASLFDFEVK